MSISGIQSVLRGPVATVPTPMDDCYRLDLGRLSALTEQWIDGGLVTGKAVIKVTAAMGEGPDLSDEEWPEVLKTTVEAAKGEATIACGLKTKNTLHTIDDVKRASDLGAVAVQIDLPIFHHPNQDDYVRYFTQISDAVDIGILIYNTYWFGAQPIRPETMLRLADAEHVVAVKWAVPPGGDISYDDMRIFADRFNVFDNQGETVRCARNGGRGFISDTAHVHPPYDLKIWELIEARKYDEAQTMSDKLMPFISAFVAKSNLKSGGYRVHKAMMDVMGESVGPPRLPTLPLDAEELEELRQILARADFPVTSVWRRSGGQE